jgi:preprotein translocase subunit YajC
LTDLIAMQGNPLITTLLMYGAIGAIFYFVLLRPQQKQRKTHDSMLRTLRKGDEIVTAGGLVGEVVFIAQQTKDGSPVSSMDDRITIKSGDTRLIVERGRIAKISRKDGEAKA